MAKPVSLKQIAEAAGVSIGTVSRVLRNQDQVAPETRQRVLAEAERLRYRPNLLVRAIQTGRTRTIGVMLSMEAPHSLDILHGIHDRLLEAGHVPIVLAPLPRRSPGAGSREREQILELIDRRVDGLIVYPVCENRAAEYGGEVRERGLPMVAVDCRLPLDGVDFVGVDDGAGARCVAEHLVALGHRRTAHLAGSLHLSTGRARRDAFQQAVEAAGGTCAVVADESFRFGHGAETLLNAVPRPTAVFVGNDYQARALLRAAERKGVRVPEDLSVAGFGDVECACCVRPALTTVHQPFFEIGCEAAAVLLERLEGDADAAPIERTLDAPLIVRESTGPPPG